MRKTNFSGVFSGHIEQFCSAQYPNILRGGSDECGCGEEQEPSSWGMLGSVCRDTDLVFIRQDGKLREPNSTASPFEEPDLTATPLVEPAATVPTLEEPAPSLGEPALILRELASTLRESAPVGVPSRGEPAPVSCSNLRGTNSNPRGTSDGSSCRETSSSNGSNCS